ncbi:MAG: Sodium Bile acid symporter family protein [Candidatus Hydrogenedentes bacterium ADurb.Bin170]|nr:MAG: Sodium Bile acid symporter family protein [Candidatus Hydrogenedentes bacterium ADurb.Bin170]
MASWVSDFEEAMNVNKERENKTEGISFFQRYLTIWVFLCMVVGVLIGRFIPAIPAALGRLEIAGISIPIAILIWVMIYPMMMKVDFQSIKQVGKNPKGLFVTWIVNWLIKPFTMYGIAYLFLFVIFKAFITPELATEYLAGAVLLGAAPCTAMVFVWSALTKGNPSYTVVQVATNDLIILIAFVPIVKFLLGVSKVSVPYSTLFISIILFVIIPLVGGVLTRVNVIRSRGQEYFDEVFSHKFDNATTIGLLLTLVIIGKTACWN